MGKPQFAKKTRGEQFFFANNRFIKNSYLNHAVMSAFEGLMPEGSHPFYVLFIEIDPVHIDINVHPTKTEIKFDDERTVYAIVQAAVRKSMSQHNLAPSLDFDTNINYSNQFFSFNNAPTPTSTAVPSKMNQADFDSERPFAKPEMSPREKSNLSNWNKLYEGLDNTVESFEQKRVEQSSFNFRNEEDYPETQPFTLKSKANDLLESRPLRSSQDSDATTFQIHNRYIISQVKSGMLLIDQRAAYERILYEKFVQYLQKNNGTSQQLLFPSTIKLTPADFHLLVEIQDEVRNLGFDLSVIGHDSFIVNGIPADSPDENEQALIEGLLEQFKRNESELHLDRVENLARSMAKRSAGRFGMSRLSNQEMNTLVEQLFASSNPSYSPSGELTMKILGLAEIANIFQK